MKLATYSDGSRDGQLVVLTRNLSQAHFASDIVGTLQAALDDWNFFAPQLQLLSDQLEQGNARYPFAWDPQQSLAPLPRAYQCFDAAQDQDGPRVWLIASDVLLGARSPVGYITAAHPDRIMENDPSWGLDAAAGLAVITADVPAGASPEQGHDAIRLITLSGLYYQHGPEDVQCQNASFGPVALTPDELGSSWSDARVQLVLSVSIDDRKLGLIEMGQMRHSFGDLIAHAARMKPLIAGTIVGSGCVSNEGQSGKGFASIAQKRSSEQHLEGKPHTPLLLGDERIRIEIKDAQGQSVFGSIEQSVVHVSDVRTQPKGRSKVEKSPAAFAPPLDS